MIGPYEIHFNGWRKSMCAALVANVTLVLVLTTASTAAPVAPDSTSASSHVETTTNPAAQDSVQADQPPVDKLSRPTATALDTGQPGLADGIGDGTVESQPGWLGRRWQSINRNIGSIANWIVVAAFIGGLFFGFYEWLLQRKRRTLPNETEQKAYDAVVQMQHLIKARRSGEMMDHWLKQDVWWTIGGNLHLQKIARQWGQIRERASALRPEYISNLSALDQKQNWGEIHDLVKHVKRYLKKNYKL
jgi:hypothetical protein